MLERGSWLRGLLQGLSLRARARLLDPKAPARFQDPCCWALYRSQSVLRIPIVVKICCARRQSVPFDHSTCMPWWIAAHTVLGHNLHRNCKSMHAFKNSYWKNVAGQVKKAVAGTSAPRQVLLDSCLLAAGKEEEEGVTRASWEGCPLCYTWGG